jgi:hypothetical protein
MQIGPDEGRIASAAHNTDEVGIADMEDIGDIEVDTGEEGNGSQPEALGTAADGIAEGHI